MLRFALPFDRQESKSTAWDKYRVHRVGLEVLAGIFGDREWADCAGIVIIETKAQQRPAKQPMNSDGQPPLAIIVQVVNEGYKPNFTEIHADTYVGTGKSMIVIGYNGLLHRIVCHDTSPNSLRTKS